MRTSVETLPGLRGGQGAAKHLIRLLGESSGPCRSASWRPAQIQILLARGGIAIGSSSLSHKQTTCWPRRFEADPCETPRPTITTAFQDWHHPGTPDCLEPRSTDSSVSPLTCCQGDSHHHRQLSSLIAPPRHPTTSRTKTSRAIPKQEIHDTQTHSERRAPPPTRVFSRRICEGGVGNVV